MRRYMKFTIMVLICSSILSMSVTSNTDERFKNLFAAINGNSEFRALKRTLEYLLDKKYNTNVSELTRIFGGEEQETNHPL